MKTNNKNGFRALVAGCAWTMAAIICGLPALPAEVMDLSCSVSHDGKLARIRWTTSEPTRCKLDFGATAAYGQTVPEDPSSLRGTTNNRADPGSGFANNHRRDVPMPDGGRLHYRLILEDRQGKVTTSRDAEVAPAPSAPGRPGLQQVKVKIERGASKVSQPVVLLGVPFPEGHLANTGQLRLVHGGREIVSQVQAVSRYWRDNSIEWARVAFPAPDRTETVTLEYGRDVRRQRRASIDAKTRGLSFSARTDRLIAWCDENGVGELGARKRPGAQSPPFTISFPRPVLEDKRGKQYTGKPEKVEIEESGPARAVVRIVGHHVANDGTKLFGYVLRLYLVSGKPFARVDYTFENDALNAEMAAIQSLDLMFELQPGAKGKGEKSRWRSSVETDSGSLLLEPGSVAFQREDFEWVDEKGNRRGKRLPGIACLTAPGGSLDILVKNFWQQYPKAFAVGPGVFKVSLLPALPRDFYARRKDEDKLYYYLRDGYYTFRQGFSKTHELWIDFSEGRASRTLIEDGPTAAVSPDWIEQSRALRALGVAVRDKFPDYDPALLETARTILARRERGREYGMMNFGDWYGERTWNWGNLEYDLGHGLLTQFARTGTHTFFWRAQEALRHQRDVDTRHYAKDPRRIGQQWTHCMGHTANYYPKTYKNMHIYASPGWSDNRGHVWAQGMLEHYLLGGDRRSWNTGLLIADWAAGPQTTNFTFGNAREPGWMTRLVMSAYFATDDPYYLNAARLMLREVHQKSITTGNNGFYYHKLGGGHCRCEKKHFGEAGFMLGVLMSGMKMFYDATGDGQVADDIVRIARFIADRMWVEDQSSFRYTSCPKTTISGGSAFIMMEGLAFAARRSKDPRLAEICRKGLAGAWPRLVSGGKTAGYLLCASAQAIQEFAGIPGPSFKEIQQQVERELLSPARRALPTLLNNPDFEETPAGWPPRAGARISLDSDIRHSGNYSLKIEGKLVRQNEYVNTTYDTAADPAEIRSLVPGETYRLTCWLRVDRLSKGVPPPSVRLSFRDRHGTRDSKTTNAYDLSRLGTWQKLSADITIPAYNTRNYIALNTNTREPVEALLFLDDVSLVPARLATKDTYTYLRLLPGQALLSPGLVVKSKKGLAARQWYEGMGTATFRLEVPVSADYFLWARTRGNGSLAEIRIDGKPGTRARSEEKSWAWCRLGKMRLSKGHHQVILQVRNPEASISRIVLTDDASQTAEN